VIHLATHGIADAVNALRSRVLLAPSAAGVGASSRDGWLEAWEVMRLDLRAEVVVLSACETGRGRVAEGEGLVGLTWALFASGIRHSVVTEWRVESQSTTTLMTGLYRRLRTGDAPAEALHSAILSLMKDPRYRHLYYWGPFVVAGSPRGTRVGGRVDTCAKALSYSGRGFNSNRGLYQPGAHRSGMGCDSGRL